MKDPKTLQKNMNNISTILFTVGAAAFLTNSQLSSLIKPDSFIYDALNFVFVIGFFGAGLALMISGISSSNGDTARESFSASAARVILKSVLYVILPAIVVTIIMVIVFVR